MLSQQLIHALAADRERQIADHLRARQVRRRPLIRWVRRPSQPAERR